MKAKDVPVQLIYAYAGEPEITATEAHFIADGLARVLTALDGNADQRPTRLDMLKIMKESGALDELDINDEDFIGGHGREVSHVKAMESAYALGYGRGRDDEASSS